MRRFSVFLSIVALVLLGVLAWSVQPVAIAQEATPAAEEMMPEGLTFEPVTFATGVEAASPFDLFVFRIGLDAGAILPSDENDPSVGIVLVESGTLTVQMDGPVSVTRGAGLAEAMMATEATGDFESLSESVTPGEAVTLEAGDAAYIGANIGGEIRNDSQERAVALGFLVTQPGDMTGEATPVP